MATESLNAILHYLRRSVDGGSSDGDLVSRFTIDRDPAAFEELLRRYESMVMNVCRRQLGPGADADDAFQATFFILARKARSIRNRESVGSWLHGVAHRLSRQMLSKRSARLRGEEKLRQTTKSPPPNDDPALVAGLRELGVILDDELRNLAAVHRAALVACYLKGLSTSEAAHYLGIPASTLKSRLQRGRDLLRRSLERRGIGLSLAALTALFAGESRAGAPASLVEATLRTAMHIASSGAAVVATRAASLAAHGLGASTFSEVTAVMCAVLAFALAGLGAALSTSPRADIAVNAAGQDASVAPEEKQSARLDPLGDPLPPGAIMRLGTARWRRPWGVTGIGFSTDGQHVVTASGHTLSILDTATGKEARQLDATNIMGLAVSHAGGVMATAQNAHVEVRDLATGKVKFSQQTPGFAVAISADGRMLASGGRTRDKADPVVLWDVRTGYKLRSLPGEMYQVFRLAFSPDGKTLAAAMCGNYSFSPSAGTRSEVVRLWDVDTGRLHELEGHTGGVTSVAFSPDGKILATGGHDGMLILWNAADRKQLHKVRIAEEAYFHRKANGVDSGGILSLAFDPNGKTIASANHDGTVRLFDAPTGKQVLVLKRHVQSVLDVAFSPNGKILASASDDQTVSLWDMATGAILNPRPGHDGRARTVLISPDGKRAVTAGRDRVVRLWDLSTGHELHVLREFKSAIESMSLSAEGDLLAVGLEDGDIQLRDAASGAVLRDLKGHSGAVRSVSFSPDGKMLASASPSGVNSNLARKEKIRSLRLWDVGTGGELPRIEGNRNDWFARFSPDGKWLAAYEGVVLWEPASGKQLRRLRDLSDFVFLPDGKRIAGWVDAPFRGGGGGFPAGGERGKVRIRNLSDGSEDYSFEGPARAPIIGGLFVLSPDGRLLAMAVNDGHRFEETHLQLWEMSTGKLRRTLRGHGGEINGCAFSSNGRVVLTSSGDTTVLVWDLAMADEPRPQVLSDRVLESLWADLGAADATRADAAIWSLVAAPQQALTLLKKNLPPTPAPHPDWRNWVKDLDSGVFTVRDKASRALEALEEQAYPVLKEALAGEPPLETRRRLERLMARLGYPLTSAKTLREVRAVEILEHIGTEPARQLLQMLAAGTPGSRLTGEAKATLERLGR